MDARDLRGRLEHLGDTDLELLRRTAPRAGVEPGQLVSDPAALIRVLTHPAVFEAVFSRSSDEALFPASPFLTFALIVHHGWVELRDARYVAEWIGPRQRLPVLGTDDLRGFLAVASRRLFLSELLASYTRVASGSTWVHTRRGWRRRRFSELDPVRLASLLEVVPEEERPGVYRRLGDLALFLTGVFPDHTALRGLAPTTAPRIWRLSGLSVDEARDLADASAVDVLERLGVRSYRLATRTAARPPTASMRVVADIAESFGLARRTLNYLTDRHLFARRTGWFFEPAT
jgi:hypothetical protein